MVGDNPPDGGLSSRGCWVNTMGILGDCPGDCGSEVQKVVNPVILDDRKYIQNQSLAENISKT